MANDVYYRKDTHRIVAETRAIQWWIDRQLERGRSDEDIAGELPVAAAFITGRLPLEQLLERRAS